MEGSSWDLSWLKAPAVRSIEEAAAKWATDHPERPVEEFYTEVGQHSAEAERYLCGAPEAPSTPAKKKLVAAPNKKAAATAKAKKSKGSRRR